MKNRQYVFANSEFVRQLVNALGITDWRRIIIDIKYDDVTTLFVEKLIDESTIGPIDFKVDREGVEWTKK